MFLEEARGLDWPKWCDLRVTRGWTDWRDLVGKPYSRLSTGAVEAESISLPTFSDLSTGMTECPPSFQLLCLCTCLSACLSRSKDPKVMLMRRRV